MDMAVGSLMMSTDAVVVAVAVVAARSFDLTWRRSNGMVRYDE